MSGTTTHGLPFPSASDPLAEGAAAIQALAEAVEKRGLQQGGKTVTTTGPDGYQSIAYPVPYGAPPVVVAILGDQVPYFIRLDAANCTATQFRFGLFTSAGASAGSGTVLVNWIALGDVTAATTTPAEVEP